MDFGISFGKLLEVVAAALCIGGGLLLFQFASAGDVNSITGQATGGEWTLGGNNVFEVLTHGVGLYCVGRGVLMLRKAFQSD